MPKSLEAKRYDHQVVSLFLAGAVFSVLFFPISYAMRIFILRRQVAITDNLRSG